MEQVVSVPAEADIVKRGHPTTLPEALKASRELSPESALETVTLFESTLNCWIGAAEQVLETEGSRHQPVLQVPFCEINATPELRLTDSERAAARETRNSVAACRNLCSARAREKGGAARVPSAATISRTVSNSNSDTPLCCWATMAPDHYPRKIDPVLQNLRGISCRHPLAWNHSGG